MSSAHLPPIPADIAKLTGPLFIGILFNWGLLGALGVQTYVYYLAFPRDRALPKYLVASAWVVELLQTVLITRDGFRVYGSSWGDMNALDDTAWFWFSAPILTALTSFAVQLFFAWRIYILSNGIWISSIVSALSCVQMVGGVWTGINTHIIGHFSEIQNRNYKQTSVWLGGTALVDFIITISMIYYLSRSRTGFRATNTLLTKFIRLTIETGFITTTFAVLDLALFLRFRDFNYHLAPATALSKLYTNSLLVLLNARVRIVGGRNTDHLIGDNSLSTSFALPTPTTSGSQPIHQLSVSKSSSQRRLNELGDDFFDTTTDLPMVHVSTVTTVSS